MKKFNLQLFALHYNNKVNVNDNGGKKVEQAVLKSGEEAKSSNAVLKTSDIAAAQTPTLASIKGVDQGTLGKMNSTFTQSQGVTDAQSEAGDYRDKLKGLASNTNIVSQETWDKINSGFKTPTKYDEAMSYTNGMLQQLSTGKTSYSDQVQAMMDKIMNRDPFEYDVDSDMLFQQYLASSMASGKTAMQDTMGQAAALTGGYGSTYATTAANQAYNQYIQDAYNNLPEYYQMAMEAYQMEGDEMYKQLGMLNDADNKEYGRLYDAFNANYMVAEDMYDHAYNEWNDTVNHAISSANLQLNEYGQIFDQTYKTYGALQDNANTMYQNEYNQWADEVNNAFKSAQMANSDYWSQQDMNYKYSSLAQDQRQFESSQAQENAQFNARYDMNGDGVVDYRDNQVEEEKKADEAVTYKEPSETQMKKALEAYNTGGEEALYQYVDSLPGDIDTDKIDAYIFGNGTDSTGYGQLPIEQRTFTKTDDTTNWFWGVDGNDVVTDQYGNTYKIEDLPESIQKKLSKLKKGESYTAK